MMRQLDAEYVFPALSFFRRRFHFDPDRDASDEIVSPEFSSLMQRYSESAALQDVDSPLDQELHASGFKRSHRETLAKHAQGDDLDEVSFSETASIDSASTDKEKTDGYITSIFLLTNGLHEGTEKTERAKEQRKRRFSRRLLPFYAAPKKCVLLF